MGNTIDSLSVGADEKGVEARKSMVERLRGIAARLEAGENPVFALLDVVPLGPNRTAVDIYQNQNSAFALSMMAFDFMALVASQAMREITDAHCDVCKQELANIAIRAQTARKLVGNVSAAHAHYTRDGRRSVEALADRARLCDGGRRRARDRRRGPDL